MQTNPTSSPEPDDAVLLRAYAEQRDLRAFEQLVARHAAMVRAVAGRVAGQGAEDVAQIVFAELARRAAALTSVTSLGAWLHRVAATQARRFVRQQWRSDGKHQAYAVEMNTTSFSSSSAEDPLHEALPVLDAALNDLQETDRELIFLRFYEGASFKHLAERLGRNDAALRQQAGRAIERLSAALKRRGVVVPATALTAGLGAVLVPTSSSATASIAALAVAARMLATCLPKATTTATTLATLSSTTKAILSAAAALAIVAVPVIHQELTAHRSPSRVSGPSTHHADKAQNLRFTPATVLSSEVSAKPENEEFTNRLFRLILTPAVSQQALKTAGALDWTEAQRLAYTEFMKSDLVIPTFDENGPKAVNHPGFKTPQDACLKYVKANFPEEQAKAFETWMAGQEVAFAESAAARNLAHFTGAINMTEAQKEALFQTFANTALKQVREGFQRQAGFNVGLSRADVPLHEDQDLLASVLTADQLRVFQLNQKMVYDVHEQLKPHGLKILLDHLQSTSAR
ncbi:MAG: RNA polymerase sigma factor [Verrucomicrobiota bacterium]